MEEKGELHSYVHLNLSMSRKHLNPLVALLQWVMVTSVMLKKCHMSQVTWHFVYVVQQEPTNRQIAQNVPS